MAVGEQNTPQNNTILLGQEEAEKILLNAYNAHKLHNSWLICGVKGIGKATLAYRFARFLLSESDTKKEAKTLATSPLSPVNNLISAGAHPDFKVIQRDYIDTDRKKIIKALKEGSSIDESELKNLKKSTFIRIDDVRTVHEFLAKKSSNDGWRVVIIDSIDDMNMASANAILKILEEPPIKSILLLISHHPEQLLPTIRSRCAKLMLKPLADNVVSSLIRRYRPEIDEQKVKTITSISSGSIGKALNYADCGAVELYQDLCQLVKSNVSPKISDILEWVDNACANEDRFTLAVELILKFYSDNILSSPRIEETVYAWENTVKILRQTESLNMDKKETLINIINNLCKVM